MIKDGEVTLFHVERNITDSETTRVHDEVLKIAKENGFLCSPTWYDVKTVLEAIERLKKK